MKSKSKRSDKELNKSHRSISSSDRKLFYNPIFVDGSTLGVHKKSKNRNVAVKDKRVKAKKDNFQLKNCTPDTTDVRSVGTITTSQDRQFQPLHKVSKDDTLPFVEENSNETTPNTSESVFGNAVLLCNDLSTNCQEAMVNIDEEGMSTKKNASVLTDPECLGPCDPGSSVVLEGIVWNESRNGLLVVNVTWRGKTYVGTLMDSSNHHWGSPCFKDGNWNLEPKDDEGEGRRLRRNRVSSQKLLRSSDPSTQNLPFHDDVTTTPIATPIAHHPNSTNAATTTTTTTTTNLKEFACTMPSCSKRFKSLSGLKTHKCLASKETPCTYRPQDVSNITLTACPLGDKSLQTNQKSSKMNGRGKQGTLKRKNNNEQQHLMCNGDRIDAVVPSHVQTKCKTKYSDASSNNFNASNDSHVKTKSNREASSVKRNEKQKKSAKTQNNTQRKKKIKAVSPPRCNSSACKSNTFSNEFESGGKNNLFNGAIKTPFYKSAETSSIKDPAKDNFLHLYDGSHKHADNMMTLKSKHFFANHLQPTTYPSAKFGGTTTTCSSPSHSGVTCTKCSHPELQSYEPLKTPVCRPHVMSLGCSKLAEPTCAPSAIPCKDDLFNTPLEANTASEVFGQDLKHYKQASSHVEEYLYSKKQAT